MKLTNASMSDNALVVVANSQLPSSWLHNVSSSFPGVQATHRAIPNESGNNHRSRNDVAGELDEDQRVIAEQLQSARLLEAQYDNAQTAFHEQELQATELERQVREQSTQMDSARLRVDRSDPSNVEDFHSKEDYYNNLVNRASAARATAGALVDPLNTLEQRVNAQNIYVNRLVDDYNAGLRRADR